MQDNNSNTGYIKTNIGLSVISLGVIATFFTYTVWFNNDSKTILKTNQSIKSSIIKTNQKLEHLSNLLIEQNTLQSKKIKLLQDEIEALKKQQDTKNKVKNATLNLLNMIGLKPNN
ncbi:MAG: hypothetical protein GXO30_04050 [Epsilonproteobacteria bacterium]|nr:hypothetical protein [Campylobacterota bacterium]